MKKFILFVFSAVLGVSTLQAEIVQQLEDAGLEVVSEVTPSPNSRYRVFELTISQPEDHRIAETSPRFNQRLVLWHLVQQDGATRPMVLQTSGYAIFSRALSVLASEFNANQVQVEHRFFADSVPASRDWSLDNIEQSAADFHNITVALKRVYSGRWVNTGRSKGGMTSVYHRKFYPNDVDATVAHVAPHSFSLEDQRYADFVADEIGGAEQNRQCRADLEASQRLLLDLANRDQVINSDKLDGEFTLLGSDSIAYEHSVIEMPWAFWQYGGPGEDCSNVPKATDAVQSHINFLFASNDPNGYNDESLADFTPYYFQASTQLGNPGTRMTGIADLLQFADTFNILSYVPADIRMPYDNAAAMREVSEWISTSSERIMYVYGGWDPWTAGHYENIRPEGDNHFYTVARRNHSAQFIDLEGEAHAQAYERLRTWLGISADTDVAPDAINARARDRKLSDIRVRTLETKEFHKIRGRKL